MTYGTPHALRMALEHRLAASSAATGVSLDRLRRRVTFERVITRLQTAEPDVWVLKGGMALEVRLGDAARLTKDIDLGLRDDVRSADALHERVLEALGTDSDGDGFLLTSDPPRPLAEDEGGGVTWRLGVSARLAGRPFDGVKLDISPRAYELTATELLPLPNSLEFAAVPSRLVEVISIHRHAAEKLHAMSRDFGDRENTRVRDLVDLVMLIDRGLLEPSAVAEATGAVWSERDGTPPPATLSLVPASWGDRYEALAATHRLSASTLPSGVALVTALWSQMSHDRKV